MLISGSVLGSEISFTMDDPNMKETPLLSAKERNEKILQAFHDHKILGALFVCGMRIDSPAGKILLKSWDQKGHIIANHTYSHRSINSDDMTLVDYESDFLKVEPLIRSFRHFEKRFRFPFLKEGNTREKRDDFRRFLTKQGYKNGYVTIDASDWYIDQRMIERLEKDPKADLTLYRSFYLQHMWERAQFYDDLAKKIFNREIKHTILIHHSLLNALFLSDVMTMFESKGWTLISAEKAFLDPVFKLAPHILPAGESIVWAAAKETKRYDDILRYPGEDDVYEKPAMDQLGL